MSYRRLVAELNKGRGDQQLPDTPNVDHAPSLDQDDTNAGATDLEAPGKNVAPTLGSVTLVAAYMGHIPLTKDAVVMHELMPRAVQLLALETPINMTVHGNVKLPLYAPATADGQAITFSVKKDPSGKDTSGKWLPNTWSAVDMQQERGQATLANYCSVVMSQFIRKGAGKPKEIPPFTIVMARNVRCSTNPKTNQISWNVDVCDTKPFAAFNALPLDERMALIFDSTQQRLPSIQDIWPLRPLVEQALAPGGAANILPGDEKKDVRNKKRIYMQSLLGNLVPKVMLSANRQLIPGPYKAPSAGVELVLPPLYGPKTQPPPSEFESVIVQFGDRLHTPPNVEGAGEGLRGKVCFVVTQSEDDEEVAKQYIRESFIYNFDSLSVYYPLWIERLLQQHSIPFEWFGSLSLIETLNDSENKQLIEGTTPSAFYSGHLTLDLSGKNIFHMRDFLLRRGIPVTEQLVRLRYPPPPKASSKNPNPAPVIPASFIESRERVFSKDSRIPSEYDVLEQYGFYGLDTHTVREIPKTEDGFRFYALPLCSLPEFTHALTNPDQVEARPDPRCTFPAEHQPKALKMTPEEGDVLIGKAFMGNLPKKGEGWFQAQNQNVPYFLFFVVRDVDLAEQHAHTLKALEAAHLPAPLDENPLPGEDLPANVNELREEWIKTIAARELGESASQQQSQEKGKHTLEHEPNDEDEPARKRARHSENEDSHEDDDLMDSADAAPVFG